jgi:hypothetical protein
MPLAGFKPAIPATGQPQIHDLNLAATGFGVIYLLSKPMLFEENKMYSSSLCAFLIHSDFFPL